METKKELVARIANALKSYGYDVHLSKSREYGFYTNGSRVVSFGGTWSWSVDFSGNYRSNACGTGWQIATELSSISEEQAAAFIAAGAPNWATRGEAVTLTTPEKYMATYGQSSGFTAFSDSEVTA
jgi:hypothetical protein